MNNTYLTLANLNHQISDLQSLLINLQHTAYDVNRSQSLNRRPIDELTIASESNSPLTNQMANVQQRLMTAFTDYCLGRFF